MIYREAIKNMIMDRGDDAVFFDFVQNYKDAEVRICNNYDVICYVKPDLYLRAEDRKAIGKAWVYKNWDWSGVDSSYEEMMQHEENPAYLVRYWHADDWERWEEDPYGWVERWRECAGDDQHGEDAREATMEEYEEHVKEHKEWYDDRWYDGYLEDYAERLKVEMEGRPAVMFSDEFEDEDEKHKEWWEPKVEHKNWLLDIVKDKWFSKIDRMTDEMCKDIYENNINIDKTPMKGNLYKNKETKALGIVLDTDDVDKSKWWKGRVKMLVEEEAKWIGIKKSRWDDEKWEAVV